MGERNRLGLVTGMANGNIFWNANERRLRALWRLIIQGVAWFVMLFVGQAVVGGVWGAIAVATGSLGAEDLADPSTVTERLMSQPVVVVALQAVSFVAVLVTVWLAARFLDRRRLSEFGLRLDGRWWADFGFGLLLGALLMALIFAVELAAGWVSVTGFFVTRNPATPFVLAILPPLITFFLVGISEELLSRGYQLTNLAEGLRGWGAAPAIIVATLVQAAFFGLLHVSNPNASAVSTFNIFIAGIFLAAGYILTGRLGLPIGLHMTWNFFQGNVFGFPVSGTDFRSGTFIGIEQGGPELWTGGAFGPEAGLVGIGAMLLGMLVIWLWVRLRDGTTGLAAEIAEPPELVRREWAGEGDRRIDGQIGPSG